MIDKTLIAKLLCVNEIKVTEVIQQLWSGYGEILKCTDGQTSYVVKYIKFPSTLNHPKGWNSNQSHHRKVKSYDVELNWYQQFNNHCHARTANYIAAQQFDYGLVLIMEDLDQSGFNQRFTQSNISQVKQCLKWLAKLHAQYATSNSNSSFDNLWPIGSYWHLATRSDEFKKMADSDIKLNAHIFDKALNECQYQTLIHGDAKVANFCFDSKECAGVDFQYTGFGIGIKDVMYLFSSCLDSEELCKLDVSLLDYYFNLLEHHLKLNAKLDQQQTQQLIKQWRKLYSIAWADFCRFLKGWSPTHYKLHQYAHNQCQIALTLIAKEQIK